ncbi:ABC-type multidrug transport system, permease component, partial [mine drainage metagenome]
MGIGAVLFTVGLGSVFFAGLLIALGSRLRSANAYFTIQSFLQLFVIFLSTVYYPITNGTPKILAAIFYGNPLTYAADTIRDAFAGTLGLGDLVSLGVLGGLAAVAFGAAAWGFRRLDLGPIQYGPRSAPGRPPGRPARSPATGSGGRPGSRSMCRRRTASPWHGS